MSRAAGLVPLVAALIAFAVAPFGELVWDDQIVVEQQMLSINSIADAFRPPQGIAQWTYDYVRPITVVTYLIDARLFGLGNAAGAHLSNVVYHALTTLFLWLLLSFLLRDRPGGATAAVIGATLFAVHPIHTESVSWITGRSDLLATMLLIPALHAAVVWRDRGSLVGLLAGPILFLMALLAKEVAIAGLAILPLLLIASRPTPRSSAGGAATLTWAGIVIPWLAAATYYLALRGSTGAELGDWSLDVLQMFALAGQALAWYLVKLVMPWPQSNFVVADMLPGAMVTGIVLLCAAALAIVSAARWRQRGDGLPFAGLFWTVAALAPSLAVTFVGVSETPVAERYLYLPSAGAALAVAAALTLITQGRAWRPALAASAMIIGAFCVATLLRGTVWLSDLRLWTDTTSKVPSHSIPWVELGKARQAAGDNDGALDAFMAARPLTASPKMTAINEFNLGAMFAERGRVDLAREAFQNSVAANPSYGRGHYGLGRLLYEQVASGRGSLSDQGQLMQLARSIEHLERGVSLAPSFVSARLALCRSLLARAALLQRSGDATGARASGLRAERELTEAKRIDPSIVGRADVSAIERQFR